jgi:hypothetical protein
VGLRRSVGIVGEIPPWKFVLASLAFFPIFLCFFHGQDSVLLLLLCTLAFRAMQNDSDVIAGCWLALGSFKFQFTIPIVLLFFIWGRRRLLPGFSAVGIILALVSLALVGSSEFLAYPAFVLRIANTPALGGVPLSLLPNLHGLVMGWPNPFPGKIGMALAVTSSVAMFVFAAQKKRENGNRPDLRLQFSLAILVSSLIGWQTTVHDLSLLVLPLALTADYGWGPRGDGSESNCHVLDLAWPLLVSPLWMVLWLGLGKVNLMAVPMLLWAWRAGAAISSGHDAPFRGAPDPPQGLKARGFFAVFAARLKAAPFQSASPYAENLRDITLAAGSSQSTNDRRSQTA